MDYNTQRSKLIMPEYGRHVQKMIKQVKDIPDRDKRNEQIKAVIGVMGIINPQLRDLSDFRHKLWDHVQIISDFEIDIESPYPIPTRETFINQPNPIPLETTPLKAAHYGRNIQNMIKMISEKPEDETRRSMIQILAYYMRQQYLIWNKDSVTEEVIFKDINKLSDGMITVPEDMHLSPITQSTQPALSHNSYQSYGNGTHRPKFRQNNKKNQKRNKPM